MRGKNVLFAIYPVIFLAAATVSQAAHASDLALDSWHYPTAPERRNAFYSEFKYFSFQSDELSGEISYYVVNPLLNPKLNVIAHLYTRDRAWTYEDTYPLHCVETSASDASLDACGERAIAVDDDGRIRIRHGHGSVRWQLTVTPLESYEGRDFSEDLPSIAPWGLDRALFPWHMSWRPAYVDATVAGTVTLSDARGNTETRSLSATTGYHDENWGVWLPMKQPYQWLRFSGVDQNGSPIHFVYADFYRSPDVGRLFLVTPEGTREFRPDELEAQTLRQGRSGSDYLSLTSGSEQLFVDPLSQDWSSGDHSFPIELELRSKDGSLRIHGETVINAATALQMPQVAQWIVGDFFQNEQIVRYSLSYDSGKGLREASGIGEQQYGSTE